MKTVVYYRVSKRPKNGVRMQRYACRKYHLSHKMGRVVEYVDEGFSGGSLERPALKRLLKDVFSGKIGRILVYRMDRLGRDFSDLNFLVKTFEDNNVELISVTQDFDRTTPEGWFASRMVMIFPEFESRLISRRTKDGLRAKA